MRFRDETGVLAQPVGGETRVFPASSVMEGGKEGIGAVVRRGWKFRAYRKGNRPSSERPG